MKLEVQLDLWKDAVTIGRKTVQQMTISQNLEAPVLASNFIFVSLPLWEMAAPSHHSGKWLLPLTTLGNGCSLSQILL
jgi:hypothetical protein